MEEKYLKLLEEQINLFFKYADAEKEKSIDIHYWGTPLNMECGVVIFEQTIKEGDNVKEKLQLLSTKVEALSYFNVEDRYLQMSSDNPENVAFTIFL